MGGISALIVLNQAWLYTHLKTVPIVTFICIFKFFSIFLWTFIRVIFIQSYLSYFALCVYLCIKENFRYSHPANQLCGSTRNRNSATVCSISSSNVGQVYERKTNKLSPKLQKGTDCISKPCLTQKRGVKGLQPSDTFKSRNQSNQSSSCVQSLNDTKKKRNPNPFCGISGSQLHPYTDEISEIREPLCNQPKSSSTEARKKCEGNGKIARDLVCASNGISLYQGGLRDKDGKESAIHNCNTVGAARQDPKMFLKKGAGVRTRVGATLLKSNAFFIQSFFYSNFRTKIRVYFDICRPYTGFITCRICNVAKYP